MSRALEQIAVDILQDIERELRFLRQTADMELKIKTEKMRVIGESNSLTYEQKASLRLKADEILTEHDKRRSHR